MTVVFGKIFKIDNRYLLFFILYTFLRLTEKDTDTEIFVYTEHLRLRLPLTPMTDENAFYIELYKKTQTLGVNR